jgi:methylase of polypeptide subunit release factors
MQLTTAGATVDASKHFRVFGARWLTTTPVEVRIMPEMYAPAEMPEHHWLHLSFTGFQVLAHRLAMEGLRCKVFASIGSSSGLDAIGAVEALNPEEVIVTDVLPTVVPIAVTNVFANCKNKTIIVHGLRGSLVEPLEDAKKKADIIYENLPNLPSPSDRESLYSNGALAASFYPRTDFEQRLLGEGTFLELHESFLRSAKSALRPNGSVVCAIGGRVPWSNIREVFRRNRYDLEILSYLLKPQEQAVDCLPVYAAAEGNHTFSFYPFKKAREVLDAHGYLGINEDVVTDDTIQEIELLLMRLRISANEAIWLSKRSEMVGHIAYLIRGIPID